MKKSIWVVLITALLMLLLAACYYLWQSLEEQKQANVELQELAELDKAEMEDQYRLFDIQYGELQKQIRNDSLLALVDKERERTQELLRELQNTKATDAREIARLKKELATVREVLRSYIRQVDSLNQINESLRSENLQIRDELAQTNREKQGLQTEKQSLTEKVAIAAQLDATGISLTAMRDGKPTRKNKLKNRKLIRNLA